MVKRKYLVVLSLFLFVAGLGFGYELGIRKADLAIENNRLSLVTNKVPENLLNNKPSEEDFSLFWTVWDKVQTMYVDKEKINTKKMVDGAIAGMVSAIGDPYTFYLPVTQNKETKEELGGEFDGVGMQLGFKEKQLVVMTPLDGTPAKAAGIMPGDYILKIIDAKNNVDKVTDGLTLPEAVKLIRGERGTKVKLTMYRDGQDKPFDVELVRDTIVVKSVTLKFVDSGPKKTAWLRVSRFGDNTEQEWSEAVNQIMGTCGATYADCKGVVVDVRNNPGGYLAGAVYLAGEFLPAGKVVVKQQYGDGRTIENKVERNGRMLNVPVTVLVNKGSASASEIFSGALQDYKRAKIVGELSFGKGSVQQPDDFPDGSGVHITIAKWLRPSNEWIDHKGIKPDVEVKIENLKDDQPENDPQLQKAIQLL